jgi:CheY-like chemotaxis protein
VICDLLMPEVDGFEVVGRLHDDPATTTIPILVLTGHELTAADKARLNGRILGVVDKGEAAASGLRDWLDRVLPPMAPLDATEAPRRPVVTDA